MSNLPDKDSWLEMWHFVPGTPEAEEAWAAKVKQMNGFRQEASFQVMGDQFYDGQQAPDGTDVSTRAKHREYMKRTGMVTFDDYADTFQKEQARRDAYHSGERGTVSRKDIERTIAQMTGQM